MSIRTLWFASICIITETLSFVMNRILLKYHRSKESADDGDMQISFLCAKT